MPLSCLAQQRGRPLLIPNGPLNSEREWITQEFQRQPGSGWNVIDAGGDRIVSEKSSCDGVANHADVRSGRSQMPVAFPRRPVAWLKS